MRRFTTIFLVGALAVTAAACGGDDDSSAAAATTPATTAATAAGDSAAGTQVSVVVGDMTATSQSMTVSPASVKAGPVTFTLANTGTQQHEMVVLKTDTPFDQLVVGADDRVSEDDSVGEIGEIPAGTTGTVTLDLAPGNYVLVCNLAKHYAQGMRVAFTVEA